MTALQQEYVGNVIALNRTYIDMAGGDLASGILLSQLVYWHTPNPQGHSRLRIKKDGHWWLAKKRLDWWHECRLTPKQFDRASQFLERLGIIVIRNYRFDGSPMKHLRISSTGFNRALQFVTNHPGEVFTETVLNNPVVVGNSPYVNIQLPKKVISMFPKQSCPSSAFSQVQLPQTGRTITEITTETTTETSSPLTPQGEKEKENLKSEIPIQETSTQLVDDEQLGSSNFFVVQKSLCEDSSSAALSRKADKVTHCEVAPSSECEVASVTVSQSQTRRYDKSLGINSPEDWKNLQQKQFDWVADGPWQLSGKLDPNFVDWLARSWQQEYGGTIHKKRSDVLRHFKKDPANIAIAWEQYNSEHLHRYKNAAVRMENGLEIQADEQQQLLTHARAVANPLPDELNPVASAAEVASLSNVPVFLPETSLLESDGEEGSLTDDGERHLLCRSTPASVPPLYGEATSPSAPPKRAERGVQGLPSHGRHSPSATSALASSSENTLASQTTTETYSFPIRPPAGSNVMTSNSSQSLNPSSIPTDDDGCAQNPGAYQEWKPTPSDDEPVSESAFSTKLAAFTKHLSMSARKQELPKSTESSQLDELNQWLADPILCKEVMTRVMRSERYTVEFDDLGKPMKIVEMKG
jgi:hypothetical protein